MLLLDEGSVASPYFVRLSLKGMSSVYRSPLNVAGSCYDVVTRVVDCCRLLHISGGEKGLDTISITLLFLP